MGLATPMVHELTRGRRVTCRRHVAGEKKPANFLHADPAAAAEAAVVASTLGKQLCCQMLFQVPGGFSFKWTKMAFVAYCTQNPAVLFDLNFSH